MLPAPSLEASLSQGVVKDVKQGGRKDVNLNKNKRMIADAAGVRGDGQVASGILYRAWRPPSGVAAKARKSQVDRQPLGETREPGEI